MINGDLLHTIIYQWRPLSLICIKKNYLPKLKILAKASLSIPSTSLEILNVGIRDLSSNICFIRSPVRQAVRFL